MAGRAAALGWWRRGRLQRFNDRRGARPHQRERALAESDADNAGRNSKQHRKHECHDGALTWTDEQHDRLRKQAGVCNDSLYAFQSMAARFASESGAPGM